MKPLGKQSSQIRLPASPEGQPHKKNKLLSTNHHQPFNAGTQIKFTLQEAGQTILKIYKINDQLVRNLLNQNLASGRHLIRWNGLDGKGKQLACGVYFYRLEHGGYTQIGKMFLVKQQYLYKNISS